MPPTGLHRFPLFSNTRVIGVWEPRLLLGVYVGVSAEFPGGGSERTDM